MLLTISVFFFSIVPMSQIVLHTDSKDLRLEQHQLRQRNI